MTYDATPRIAIVTGAATGIGRGIASELIDAGYQVVLAGRRRNALAEAATELDPSGERAYAVAVDISSPESCRSLVDAVLARWGRLDVLCLNAGIYPTADLAAITPEHVEGMFATNVYGTVYMVQAATPALGESGTGRIVLTSSITGPITGMPGYSVYGASKAAQLGFMRGAALELAPLGITINAVLPGKIAVETTSTQDPAYIAAATRTIPVGRIGAPSDIAQAVLYLSSPRNGFVTGQTIVVDGGQVIPEVISG